MRKPGAKSASLPIASKARPRKPAKTRSADKAGTRIADKSKARVASPGNPKSGLPHALGMRFTSVTRKKVRAEMRIKPMHLTRWGYVHGGAIMAFADAVGAAGTVANLMPGHRTVTIESKTNFFSAGKGPVLTAVSVPLHIGRRTMVWQTTISNADERRVALITQTQIVLAPADD